MKTRVITGILLLAFFIPPFIIGGWYLNIVLMLLVAGASYELFQLYNKDAQLPLYLAGIFMLLAILLYFLVASYFTTMAFALEWAFFAIALTLVIGGLLLVLIDEFHSGRFGELLVTVLYPAITFGVLYGLREMGLDNIAFLFLITIVTDVFAYLVGINFGKHRLAIKISPKKSIEGSIGGTAFAIVFAMLYLVLRDVETIGAIPINTLIGILLIVLISVVAQIGDLVASKLKRTAGIKDFSNLFPGHGGILDRFDSVLFAGLVLMMISMVVDLL